MAEIDRLVGATDWIDLEFVERERTPEPIVEVGIQLHLGGLSLSNTKQILERLGVERSRTAIHNWVQKTDLQPTGTHASNQVAIDETVIRVGEQRYWLYAAVDPETNEFLHVRLYPTRNNSTTKRFLQELCEKHSVNDSTFLIDEATHLVSVLTSLGLRFRIVRHGNRNRVERVFREVNDEPPRSQGSPVERRLSEHCHCDRYIWTRDSITVNCATFGDALPSSWRSRQRHLITLFLAQFECRLAHWSRPDSAT